MIWLLVLVFNCWQFLDTFCYEFFLYRNLSYGRNVGISQKKLMISLNSFFFVLLLYFNSKKNFIIMFLTSNYVSKAQLFKCLCNYIEQLYIYTHIMYWGTKINLFSVGKVTCRKRVKCQTHFLLHFFSIIF